MSWFFLVRFSQLARRRQRFVNDAVAGDRAVVNRRAELAVESADVVGLCVARSEFAAANNNSNAPGLLSAAAADAYSLPRAGAAVAPPSGARVDGGNDSPGFTDDSSLPKYASRTNSDVPRITLSAESRALSPPSPLRRRTTTTTAASVSPRLSTPPVAHAPVNDQETCARTHAPMAMMTMAYSGSDWPLLESPMLAPDDARVVAVGVAADALASAVVVNAAVVEDDASVSAAVDWLVVGDAVAC